jgi:hypothetical protein
MAHIELAFNLTAAYCIMMPCFSISVVLYKSISIIMIRHAFILPFLSLFISDSLANSYLTIKQSMIRYRLQCFELCNELYI